MQGFSVMESNLRSLLVVAPMAWISFGTFSVNYHKDIKTN